MNSRWAALVAASLVAFASLVITWQFRHYDGGEDRMYGAHESLAVSFLRGNKLAEIFNIVDRSQDFYQASGEVMYLDLVLPSDARIFMADMTGPTNYNKIGYYFYATYYLFPREVGVSVDQPTYMAKDRFLGRTAESDQEILAHGFDVRIDSFPGERLSAKALRDLPMRFPTNPAWFNSGYDTAMAFLLPLLTALAGMWLFRLLFPTLSGRMPLLEQLACSLGLGMMAVAALTQGVKLCGWHGNYLVFLTTGAGAVAEMWRNLKAYLVGIVAGYRKMVRSPVAIAILVTGSLVFLILFRLASLDGLVDGDATRWMLKAKIIHLYTGNEMVQWFSNPRLAYAHLDYPTLVPSLHAATYDSLGHADEFVTKFWPTWMLLFLLIALTSLNRAGNNWRHVSSFVLLGLLLLPATQMYVHWEGSTLPLIFFTVMGFVQCAIWLVGKDRARLGLGLTLLFGGAMTHFEGFIILALVGSWMLLLPSARPSLKPSSRIWRVLGFCFLAALPFACLRVQIPSLHFESGWAGYALHDPRTMLSNWPGIFMIQFARLFVNPDYANWGGEDGGFHWIGRWDGLSSLYNHSTLGLAWFCLWLTVALWFAVPARRRVIVWMLAMLVGALIAFSGVFASFVSITTTQQVSQVIGYTQDTVGGRYLLPILLAWFATIMTLFFADLPSSTSTLALSPTVTKPPADAGAGDRGLPGLKNGYWLAVGALLILVLGVFIIPKNKSSLLGNPMQNSAATNSLNGPETNAPENPDFHTRLELADQLNQAGKFAEALQAYRELARLYPDNPTALNNLAWSLAANPRQELRNRKEAVQLASKAVELTGQQNVFFMRTLAAVYAEDGQLAKAVEMAEKARNFAILNHHLEMAAEIEQLLKLFSAGKAINQTNEP